MPSLTMWSAVLQTTVICTLAGINVHHHSEGIFTDVTEDPTFKNFTSVWWNQTDEWAKHQNHLDSLTSNHSLLLNTTQTYPNGTFFNTTSSGEQEHKESYYKVTVPYNIVASLLICILQYQWYMFMERCFPARSRRYVLPPSVEQEKIMSDAREEQVVNKWVAQGRVNRASLNWRNTFLKWILSMTVMRAVYYAGMRILTRSLRLMPVKEITRGLFASTLMDVAVSFLHITTLAELIAFIVVPAHKQIVFVAGMELAFEIFFMTVVRMAATWAVRTDWVQTFMRNMTESALETTRKFEAQRKLMKQEL